MTNDPLPLRRFEGFLTYAPFGGELVGFIDVEDALSLESRIHYILKDKRLNGEWFDITKKSALKIIGQYSKELKGYNFLKQKELKEFLNNFTKNKAIEHKKVWEKMDNFFDGKLYYHDVMSNFKMMCYMNGYCFTFNRDKTTNKEYYTISKNKT